MKIDRRGPRTLIVKPWWLIVFAKSETVLGDNWLGAGFIRARDQQEALTIAFAMFSMPEEVLGKEIYAMPVALKSDPPTKIRNRFIAASNEDMKIEIGKILRGGV